MFAGWLGMVLGTYTHVVNCLHYYRSDLDDLKVPQTAELVMNPESIGLPKPDSDNHINFLSNLITKAVRSCEEALQIENDIHTGGLAPPYANMSLIIVAAALRRHGDSKAAIRVLKQVSNPCLLELSRLWFARMGLQL
jgi:thymidylate synthase